MVGSHLSGNPPLVIIVITTIVLSACLSFLSCEMSLVDQLDIPMRKESYALLPHILKGAKVLVCVPGTRTAAGAKGRTNPGTELAMNITRH